MNVCLQDTPVILIQTPDKNNNEEKKVCFRRLFGGLVPPVFHTKRGSQGGFPPLVSIHKFNVWLPPPLPGRATTGWCYYYNIWIWFYFFKPDSWVVDSTLAEGGSIIWSINSNLLMYVYMISIKTCPIHGTLAQIASQLVVDSNSYLQARIYTSQVQDVFHEHHLDFLLQSLWGDLGCDCQSSRLISGVLHRRSSWYSSNWDWQEERFRTYPRKNHDQTVGLQCLHSEFPNPKSHRSPTIAKKKH